ncbi:hypothetical protein ACS0TY_029452 [Phlomoides rotata]
MAPESNWLSFSLSSMEMLNNSSSPQPAADPHHNHYYTFADNFYNNTTTTGEWPTQKMYSDAENNQMKEQNSSIYYMQQPPKLEDFFTGDSTDSSLTHIYHHQGDGSSSAAYFSPGEQQDLKSIMGFPANSGSEVDDSAFPVEPGTELVAYSHCPITTASTNGNGLSLGVNGNESTAIVAVGGDSDSSKKIGDTFGQRTSIYRGVTRHRWTGRYEAHLWDNSCRREGQARKGRQVYLGGYDKEDKAARAYDLAALKYWGPTATTNFPFSNYTRELEEMKNSTKQEFIASLRRKSSGFSRGASIYRGVTRHHQQGRWQARIGRVAGNKDLYLGTFATEEEAAEAYDIAAIKFRGVNAVTNFEMSRYDIETIANSPLPIGGTAKRLKLSLEGAEEKQPVGTIIQAPCASNSSSSSISFSAIQPASTIPYGVPFDNSTPYYHHNLFFNQYSGNQGLSASSVSSIGTPMTSAGEYFVWPHQSY